MIKRIDGFTLLEIVISIAALSFISVFILRLFLASSNMNERAKNTDIAVNLAMTEIEELKKHTSLSEYLEADADGELTLTLSSDSAAITVYYDDNWNTIDSDDLAESANFCLRIAVGTDEPRPSPDGVVVGRLFTVQADVTDLSASETGLVLASLSTKKYFPNGFGEGTL